KARRRRRGRVHGGPHEPLTRRAPLLTPSTLACAVARMLTAFSPAGAAQTATVRVDVTAAGAPVAGASVVVNGTAHRTGDDGHVTVEIAAGAIDVVVSKEGLAPGG